LGIGEIRRLVFVSTVVVITNTCHFPDYLTLSRGPLLQENQVVEVTPPRWRGIRFEAIWLEAHAGSFWPVAIGQRRGPHCGGKDSIACAIALSAEGHRCAVF
jgi:hypothetical protein